MVHHASLLRSRTLATDVVEYVFALDADDAALAWRAGQFISVNVGTTADDLPILRSYSLASRPRIIEGGAGGESDGQFTLIVKLVEGGPASEWLKQLPVGGRMRFTGPMGFFVLELAHAGDVVLAATGTGIAPFIPMVEELLARSAATGETGRIRLHFGVRKESDLFWLDELARLDAHESGRFSSSISLTQPAPGWSGARGRITPRIFDELPTFTRPTFYLCGNGAMIRELKTGLVERGIDRKRQIRTEAFFD